MTTELKTHLQNYESAFKELYSKQGREPVNPEKVMKKEILEIIELLCQDSFQLGSIHKIEELVESIFVDNEDYLHILPQIYLQYFYQQHLQHHWPAAEVEKTVATTIQKIV